jgi:hypothetical protein
MYTRLGLIGAGILGVLVFVVVTMQVGTGLGELESDKVVKAWLEDLCKGGDGRQGWSADSPWSPPQLFAVQSYTVIAPCWPGPCLVRIHSSRQDGSPIVRLYEVLADRKGVYRVRAQGDKP